MSLKMFQPKEKDESSSKIKYILGIAAGKGGVGKSSITVNLALALKQQGFSVGVMDIDIYGPSIRKMLPEDRLPSQKGPFIYPALCSGIKMISMAYFRKEHEAAVVRAPIANGLVTQFIKNVVWDELDFLLIDFPPGTGDVQLTISQQANLTGAIMVTTPQEVAILDVRKAMHMFEQVHVPVLGIVENMSYYLSSTNEKIYLFGQGGGYRLAQDKGVPFLGQIPLDPLVCSCGDKGQSLFTIDSSHTLPVTQAFIQLAEQTVAHSELLKQQTSQCLAGFELIWKEM